MRHSLLFLLLGTGLALPRAAAAQARPALRSEFLDSAFAVLPSAAGARYRRETEYTDSLGGEVRDYYLGGQLQSRGRYENIRREIIHGAYDTYYPTGQLESHTNSTHGRLEGEQVLYYPDGTPQQRLLYAAGQLTSSQCFSATGQPAECPVVVEVMPVYPEGDGGDRAIQAAIVRNFRYPRKAARAGIQGQVLVTFAVDEQGAVTDVRLKQGLSPAVDEAALQAVRRLRRFQPGTQNGKPVKVRFSLPLNLNIQ